jgi:SAM-dependent methyltransferase
VSAESRARWQRAAAGWERHADAMRRATMPVSAWMVDAIGPQPGDTVLDLAAGTGDTGFLAAELIQPGGTLITSDFVPEMLSAAQRRAEALGVRNARFRQIDARSIDQPAASVDGVLCRWGYMLLDDPNAALRETRRILRPGRRLALAAWTGPEDNRWSSAPREAVTARGLVEPPDPDAPGQFTWAPEGVIAEQLEQAGFVEYEIDRIDFAYEFPSAEGWWATVRELSGVLSEALAGLGAEAEAELVEALRRTSEPWTRADGTLRIPASTWVAAGMA